MKNVIKRIIPKTKAVNSEALTPQKKHKKAAILVIAGLLCVGGVVAFAVLQNNNKTAVSPNCAQYNQEAQQLLVSNKPQEVVLKLKPYEASCGRTLAENEVRNINNTTQTIDVINFKSTMAKGLYLSGDKKQAKVYAQNVTDMIKYLNDPQREQIPDKTGLYFDMGDIISGSYTYNSPKEVKRRAP